ncbi:MAG: hypothetical protein QT05_C0032G0005 [archaeon GW2011_AR13]|nr:MAG: hypothetical protein QT05_C0032G0005 [archaeon GW2011_AR13]HIG94200.1 hypothetical protein [Nanoarchaeota archaeon]HIH62690.1 hypothetical protein [Nanoarchaeota archaeon]HIJ09897.1 hypothetical protein [Nanoarchaeota archaeon]
MDNKIKFKLGLIVFLIGFLIMNNIYALDINCCPKMIDKSICQEILDTDTSTCSVSPLPVRCEEFSDCQLGCCIDKTEGLCTTQAPRSACEDNNGTWEDDASCSISECQKGCCVIQENSLFVTDQRCDQLSNISGVEKDFREVQTEMQCLMLKGSGDKGACVFGFVPRINETNNTKNNSKTIKPYTSNNTINNSNSTNNTNSSITGYLVSNNSRMPRESNESEEDNGACRITTESECYDMGGMFANSYLCSHPDLNTGCKRQTSIDCSDTSDEIFWFDSCGNKENIYSSNKDASWNGGMMMSKEQSCGAGSSNANSQDCGNCNYILGSICAESENPKVKDGDFICKDMNCVEKDGTKRQNGESWCVYDSYIGDGKDTVGSRHWKRLCTDGEIDVEPCADYRAELCAQKVTEVEMPEGGKKSLTVAKCVINEGLNCIFDYNDPKDAEKTAKCLKNTDCMINHVYVSEYFQFDFCTARYPKGFELKNEDDKEDRGVKQKALCSMSSQNCTVIYEKKRKGMFGSKWVCVANCECQTDAFIAEMNDLCISMGDCGTYINYIGEGTKNIGLVNNPGDVAWEAYKHFAEPVKGQFVAPKEFRGPQGEAGGEEEINTYRHKYTNGYSGEVNIWGTNPDDGWIANWNGHVEIKWLSKTFGMDDYDAYMWSQLTTVIIKKELLGVYETGSYGIPSIVWVIIDWIQGIGKTKKVIVEFHCNPWKAPLGGINCEKCNGDLLKPCSKYRCDSLGQACMLSNLSVEFPLCLSADANDGKPPVISPLNVSKGYKFMEETANGVKIRTEDGKCIPEFTTVKFSLKTDKFAQCKYSLNRTKDYTDMDLSFAETTAFTKNHTTSFMMPSYDSLINELDPEVEFSRDKFANFDMFVRCQDGYGNVNKVEYVVNLCVNDGPDKTAPWITRVIPENGKTLRFNTTSSPVTVYVNEPANCRYDTIANKKYENMTYNMTCQTELSQVSLGGWPCSANLTNLSLGNNNFYFKCKDQPWLPEDNETRNVNSEDYVYSLYVSEHKFNISSISPQDIIKNGFEPAPVTLKAQTFGGVDSGKGTCEYSFAQNGSYYQFLKTFGYTHTQVFDLMGGNYTIYVKCHDESDDEAYGTANFELQIDTTPPVIINYSEDGKIELYTDEKAECFYHPTKCNFDIDNATSMTVGFSQEHFANWDPGITYHVKCADVWGNTNPDCAVILNSPDLELPIITRAYNAGNSLNIITSEIAKCYYDFETCYFKPENAPSMTPDLETEHTVNWIPGKVYHIKCADAWGNYPMDCSRKISM